MYQPEHPDFLTNQTAIKQITRGGRQAADDQAMEAYWLALSVGMDHEKAAEVFSNTYIQVLHDSSRSKAKGH